MIPLHAETGSNHVTTPTIACVLRSGGEYLPEHVCTLRDSIYEHSTKAHRFVCLSDRTIPGVEVIPLDYPYPGWWAKLCLFAPATKALGDILYFDLDTVIVGSLTDIAEVSYLTLLADFYQPDLLGSGMMYLPVDARERVWQDWAKGPESFMERFRGDQEYLHPLLRDHAERWQVLLPGQVVSFKTTIRPIGRIPADVRIICFHGRPRPWAAPEWFRRLVGGQ